MPDTAQSLLWIAIVAAAAALIATVLPRRLVPDVVLLLVGGILIGPHVLSLAEASESIGLLHDLGLGVLFLLAGYHVRLDELGGARGRRAVLTWGVCLALAFVLATAVEGGWDQAVPAVAIVLTTTALGTLLPILRDAGALGTPFSSALVSHAAWGELGPIVAMSLLLGSRRPGLTLLVLLAFLAVAAALLVASRYRDHFARVAELVERGSDRSTQTGVRLTLLLLTALAVLAYTLELDTVLGAFAAGLVLRAAIPRGHDQLETKLDAVGYGLLIPVFFIVSGMGIDPSAIGRRPWLLVTFVLALLLVRGLPVAISARRTRDGAGRTEFGVRDSIRMGIYATTGLPLIVAVSSVAVGSGYMTQDVASILIFGGAVTVLVMPLVATLLDRPGSPEPVDTV